jgi:phospholipase C
MVSKGCNPSITMGYFDGNTVTALWNYAQHFSMNDNFFASTFGCWTPVTSILYQDKHTEQHQHT